VLQTGDILMIQKVLLKPTKETAELVQRKSLSRQFVWKNENVANY